MVFWTFRLVRICPIAVGDDAQLATESGLSPAFVFGQKQQRRGFYENAALRKGLSQFWLSLFQYNPRSFNQPTGISIVYSALCFTLGIAD